MATWDENELALAVLRRIGIVGAGQSAEAEDANIVKDLWISEHAQLRRHRLVPFAIGAIEEEYQEALAKHIAGEVYGYFGVTGAREQSIVRDAQKGWLDLQEQAGADRTVTPVRPEYF